jgi:hypothetical protein
VLGLLLLVAGCGGGAGADTSAVPATTASTSTSGGADIEDTSAQLCSDMRDAIGSLPSPKKGGDADFEQAVLEAQQTYLDGMSRLPVDPAEKDTLERLLIAQQELFDAQAAARASDNPEEMNPEGGQQASDATGKVGQLATELGVTDCASV